MNINEVISVRHIIYYNNYNEKVNKNTTLAHTNRVYATAFTKVNDWIVFVHSCLLFIH